MNKRRGTRDSTLIRAAGLLLLVPLAACAGTDVQINAPILEAAGIQLSSKPPPEPNLEKRPPLVVPPSTEKLPEPGEKTAAVQPEVWPDDPDIRAKKLAEQKEAEHERYCREGDWSKDADIDEFNKNIGRYTRCQTKLGKALSEGLSGKKAPAESQ